MFESWSGVLLGQVDRMGKIQLTSVMPTSEITLFLVFYHNFYTCRVYFLFFWIFVYFAKALLYNNMLVILSLKFDNMI